MHDFLQTVRLVDPLLLWCVYLVILCVGLYLIELTHPRVKSDRDMVYYNSRRDDGVPTAKQRAPGPIEESEET